jgi:hypothetical protein
VYAVATVVDAMANLVVVVRVLKAVSCFVKAIDPTSRCPVVAAVLADAASAAHDGAAEVTLLPPVLE